MALAAERTNPACLLDRERPLLDVSAPLSTTAPGAGQNCVLRVSAPHRGLRRPVDSGSRSALQNSTLAPHAGSG
eukprot:10176394-Alexandrium_andersonii.AAC.1